MFYRNYIANHSRFVFDLDVEPKELLRRVFAKNMTLDYYESGEDLGLSDDV